MARTFTVPDFGPNDLLTSDEIGARRVKTEAMGFVESVAFGAVDGVSIQYSHGYAESIGSSESLIWPLNRQFVFSDTASNLYISSSNAADTQNIQVEWLDNNYNQQTSVITLSGQTPVLIGLGLRVNNMFTVSFPGTTGDVYVANENNHAGGIPVNDSAVISFFEARTQTSSLMLYTVPLGHTIFGLSGYFSASKNRDYDFYWNVRNPAAGLPDINTNVLSVYQNTVEVDFQYTSVPQLSDIFFTANTQNAAGRVSCRVPFLLVNNDFL